MFDFSTETILNDVSRAAIVTPAQDPSVPATEVALFIKKLGKFYEHDSVGTKKTTNVYKRVGSAPVNEIITIAGAGLVPADLVGKVIRLSLDVRLSGQEEGSYSRWAVNKGQPFYGEFYVSQTYATAADLVAAIAPAFNKAIAKGTNFEFPQLSVAASGTNIVITALDEYQRFVAGNLELIDSATDDFPVILAAGSVTTAGAEGFGTSWFITKNLRLPTIEAIRFMGENQDERPIANTIYNQFVLVKEADRAITTHALVGAKATSKTHHVIYVPQADSAAFEALVAQLVTAVETVG